MLSLRKQQIDELRTFRKYAVNRLKSGKQVRSFVSKVLPFEMVESLNESVAKSSDIGELRKSFEQPIRELEMLNVNAALTVRNSILKLI